MKRILITTLIILMLTLTACSASASPTADSAAPAGSLPQATQLIIGTMKLDGTEQDVTAEQAAELLPLWQVYSELVTSDAAAQDEIDGLLNQIQETMTDEQMTAISDLNLSQQDVMAVMQEQGLGMGGSQSLSAEQIATAQAARSSGEGGFVPPVGDMPPGDVPAGGPGNGSGFGRAQGLSPEQIATARAERGESGGFNRVPAALIQALIELLKTKATS
jgi:hypothetical protein